MFSDAPQVFTTLTIGLLMAFAFQLLLTILGTALGLTALGFQSDSSSASKPSSGKFGNTVRTVGFAAGTGILVTINTVLFAACFLSVKLSTVVDPILGSILGIVIWSAYLLILTWISSTAIGSLTGAILGSVASGFRGVVSVISTALGSKDEQDQPVLTEAAVMEAVQQEVKAAVDAADVQGTLENYLQQVQPPKLDLETVRRDLETLLTELNLRSLSSQYLSDKINRDTFVNLLRDRTDLSPHDVEQLVEQLETIWQQATAHQPERDANRELLRFLRSTNPQDLKFEQLTAKLEELLGDRAENQSTGTGLLNAQAIDFKALLRTLLQRIDLSDLDIEQIWSQLQSFTQRQSSSTETSAVQAATAPFSTIRADVEDYLLNSYPWNLERKTVQLEFEDVLYDPDADPGLIRQQLEQLHRNDFVELLKQRDDLSASKVNKIVDRLESVQLSVLERVQTLAAQEQAQAIRLRLEDYFGSIKKTNPKPKSIHRTINALLQEFDVEAGLLTQVLNEFDRKTLKQILQKRGKLAHKQAEQQLDDLEELRDRLLVELQTVQEQPYFSLEKQWEKLESYLRYTSTERLTPKNVKRKLQNLFKDVQVGLAALHDGFDRERLSRLLERRQGLTPDRINQLLEQIEKTWSEMLHNGQQPGQWAAQQAASQYDSIATTLANYMHKVDWADLNLADLKQSLVQLFSDPQAEALALGLLAQISWKTMSNSFVDILRDRLKQRQDLSETEIEQMLDRLQNLARQLVKAPRRWATRTSQPLQEVADSFKDYLFNNEKTNFSPDAIQHDLERLLKNSYEMNHAEVHEKSFVDYVSASLAKLDRAMLEVLQERDDVTEADIQQILSNVETVRDRLLEHAEQTYNQSQTLLDESLSKLRHYLNSLKLPDLSYDTIEDQVRNLLDLSQSRLESWETSLETVLSNASVNIPGDRFLKDARDRLDQFSHQFNRETLVSLLNARDDIPRSVAHQLTERLEATRDRLLNQVEALQQKAESQLDHLKQQTQRNAIAARKAAAAAAWWLFSITLTSGVSAAIAGALATK